MLHARVRTFDVIGTVSLFKNQFSQTDTQTRICFAFVFPVPMWPARKIFCFGQAKDCESQYLRLLALVAKLVLARSTIWVSQCIMGNNLTKTEK